MVPAARQMAKAYRKYLAGSLVVGLIASAVLAFGAVADPAQFYRAYLAAYAFYFGLTMGSMALLMIYHTVGGAWGFLIRRFLEAAVRTFPLTVLGFLPIAVGIGYLYPWAAPQTPQRSELLAGQSVYMNETFFYGRAIGYFVLWGLLAWGLGRWSRQQDRSRQPNMANWLDGLSGVGLLLFGVSMHFAAVDWLLALQPSFHSTIFGPLVVSGQILSAHCASPPGAVLVRGACSGGRVHVA